MDEKNAKSAVDQSLEELGVNPDVDADTRAAAVAFAPPVFGGKTLFPPPPPRWFHCLPSLFPCCSYTESFPSGLNSPQTICFHLRITLKRKSRNILEQFSPIFCWWMSELIFSNCFTSVTLRCMTKQHFNAVLLRQKPGFCLIPEL